MRHTTLPALARARPCTHPHLGALATALALLALAALAPAPRAQLALEVNAALQRAVERVLAAQREDGSFGPLDQDTGTTASYPVGSTALALYALRKSGVRADHPGVARTIDWLLAQPFSRTYSVSALVLALDAHKEPGHEQVIRDAAAWLESHFDENARLWAYPDRDAELSNTQFAVMALRAAANHGHEVAPRVWTDVIGGALSRQRADGGFFYREGYWGEPSATMTTAGLTTLYVALEMLERTGRTGGSERSAARDGIERGWAWLDARFGAAGGAMGHAGVFADRYPAYGRSAHQHYYYLYGLERVAAFGGRKLVGGRAWYPPVALEILGHESPNGGWGNLENTCLAMLVLRRVTVSGTREPPPPIAVAGDAELAKADAGDGAAGNATPGDGSTSASGDAASDSARAPDAGVEPPITWAFTFDEPSRKWIDPGFDDRGWHRGPGGFGSKGATGLVVRTPWRGRDVWVRRSFDWSPADGDLRLFVNHDDAVKVWINGVLAADGPLWSEGRYKEYALGRSVQRGLRRTGNVIAATAHDTGGGRSLDVRFTTPADSAIVSAHWRRSAPGPDVTFVRRWELLGPIADPSHEALLAVLLPDTLAAGRKPKGHAWEALRALGNRVVPGDASGDASASLTWASAWFHAPVDVDGYLWLGTADGLRAWLDGAPLALLHEHGSARADELRVPLVAPAGSHRLVLALERAASPVELFARLAAADGAAVPGLAWTLAGEAPDDPRALLAHPEGVALSTLLARLPSTSTTALRFDREDDLATLAFDGCSADMPRWIARADGKQPGSQPPSGARGVLGLAPPSAESPARVLVRVELPSGASTVSAELSLSTEPGGGATVRLGLFDGSLRWLAEQTLEPPTGRGRPRFTSLTAPLGELATRDVLLLLEVSAPPGGAPEPVFVDELSLR